MKKIDEIKSKINGIKNSINDKSGVVDNVYEKYLKDLPSTDQFLGKKLDQFSDKRKKKIENNKDIFSELLGIVDSFTNSNKTIGSSDKFIAKQKIKLHAMDSAKIVLESSREILQNNIKKIFFSGEGICGSNSVMKSDTINLKPKEIDFLNILTIDPESNMGKIVYEPEFPFINKQKVNRKLYETFTSGSYTFITSNEKELFNVSWNVSNQEFVITGLTQNNSSVFVEDFLNDYYSSIELPDITGITKTAMLLTIQGDGSETLQFNVSLNNLDRLLKKLFAICGSSTKRDELKNQNPIDMFDENEETVEFYFDFDDVDGIDLDEEDARLRKVLRFRDCDNFEVPVNTDIIEDFVYLTDKKTINDLVNVTLTKAASDVHEKSESDIPLTNFNISLLNTFILSLPKAIISSIFTPKIFLPVVTIYKMFKSTSEVIDVKDIMKKLSKLYYNVIKELYWKFVREFWKKVKTDLTGFVKTFVTQVIKTKYKRYVSIIQSVTLLKNKIKFNGIDNCDDLFNTVLNTIDKALSAKGGFSIPGILLSNADLASGFSNERAILNIFTRIESNGISLGPIFGEENNLPKIIKSMINGLIEEIDQNGYIKTSNKQIILPSASGPIIIPPGVLNSSGKLF